MQAAFSYLVKPLAKRYDNTTTIANTEIVINSSIENHRFVSREAVVLSVPAAYTTEIKVGDTILVHFNLFRRFYDIRGNEKNSSMFFRDDTYFCPDDMIYMVKKDGEWKPIGDRCFVQPIKTSDLSLDKFKPLIGTLKYGNDSLKASQINPGDVVGFTPNSEYEFWLDGELLYCMKSKDITGKYGIDERDETENNRCSKSCCRRINKSCKRTDCRHGRGCECGQVEECSCN